MSDAGDRNTGAKKILDWIHSESRTGDHDDILKMMDLIEALVKRVESLELSIIAASNELDGFAWGPNLDKIAEGLWPPGTSD